MNTEVWKAILGYEENYEVSSLGRVKSLSRVTVTGKIKPERLRTLSVNKRCGRLQVTLYKYGKSRTWKVHSLVAHAFLGEQLKGMDVNHIDGNKLNNAVQNLEYCTRSENQLHAIRLGLNPHWHENHPLAKLKEFDIETIRILSAKGVKGIELSKQFKISRAQISRILTGKRWK